MQLSLGILVAIGFIVFIGLLLFISKCYRKVLPGTAMIRNGWAGTQVSFTGKIVLPILHKFQVMDISVKRVEIERSAGDGLICKDNLRADIKVVFFVRVNKTENDVLRVADMIGVTRASTREALNELFDAKFSESLKTVGKLFEFEQLYNARREFKEQIVELIGTDLNGYTLEDASIDYLEQTDIHSLKDDNILDSQGIKKITELTAIQRIKSNQIRNDERKTITQQDVDAREAILEMERQKAESEERQRREVANIKSRESSDIARVQQEERQKAEQARIIAEEEILVAEENKMRQIIVAQKNKERTEAIESERIEKDRMLEATEREKTVSLATIEKEKALEIEKRNIQDTIRERIMVEKSVVEEEERIKDTRELAEAERAKAVTLTEAERDAEEEALKRTKEAEVAKKAAELKAEQDLVTHVKAAEAERKAAELQAEQRVIEAESLQSAAIKKAEAKKVMADATAAEEAASGLAEAQVISVKSDALKKQGEVEADIMLRKSTAEAEGISKKASSMKELDGVGKEHEEFKLRLNKDRDLQLASINMNKDVAIAQSSIVAEALKTANIDIVGGETQFFNNVIGAITEARSVDRLVKGSEVLSEVKDTFFQGNDPEFFKTQLRSFIDNMGVSIDDMKNIQLSTLFSRLSSQMKDDKSTSKLNSLKEVAGKAGLLSEKISSLLGV
ncbi:MAG: flotillin family protein [Planctomycetes bacterium]|nr:flotillin family protein [Planctomycetota bacterium]